MFVADMYYVPFDSMRALVHGRSRDWGCFV